MGVEASKPEDTANEDAIQTKEKRKSISKNDDLVWKHVRPQVCYPMKIIIRGSRGSGKSSLFKRLKGEPLNLDTELTPEIQIASINWELKTADDHSKIDIWDVVDDGYLLESTGSTTGDTVDGNTGSNAVRIGKHRYQPLDVKAVDVYKDTQAVIFVINPFVQLSFDYVKQMYQQIPLNICIVLLLNFKDITSTTDRRIAVTKADVIELSEEIREHRNQSQLRNISSSSGSINSSDRDSSVSSTTLGSTNMMLKECESIFVLEVSMLNCFGLTELYKYLEIPFLFTKKRLLTQQLERVNADLFKTNDKLQRNIAVTNTEESYIAFTRKLESRRNGTNQSASSTSNGVAAAASINSHSEKSTTATVQKVDTDKAVTAVPSSSSQSVSSLSSPSQSKLPITKRSESQVSTAIVMSSVVTNKNTDDKTDKQDTTADISTNTVCIDQHVNNTHSTPISTQSITASTGVRTSSDMSTATTPIQLQTTAVVSAPPPSASVTAITKNDMSKAEHGNHDHQQEKEPDPLRPARTLKKVKRASIISSHLIPIIVDNTASVTATSTIDTNNNPNISTEERDSTANPSVIIRASSTDDVDADTSPMSPTVVSNINDKQQLLTENTSTIEVSAESSTINNDINQHKSSDINENNLPISVIESTVTSTENGNVNHIVADDSTIHEVTSIDIIECEGVTNVVMESNEEVDELCETEIENLLSATTSDSNGTENYGQDNAAVNYENISCNGGGGNDDSVSLDKVNPESIIGTSNHNGKQLSNSSSTLYEPKADEALDDSDEKEDEMTNVPSTTAPSSTTFESASSSNIPPTSISALDQESMVTCISTTKNHEHDASAHINTTAVTTTTTTTTDREEVDDEELDGSDNNSDEINNMSTINNDDHSDNNISNNDESKNNDTNGDDTKDIRDNGAASECIIDNFNNDNTTNPTTYSSDEPQQMNDQQQLNHVIIAVDNDSSPIHALWYQISDPELKMESQEKVVVISAHTDTTSPTAAIADVQLQDVICNNTVDSCNGEDNRHIKSMKPSVDDNANVNSFITIKPEKTIAITTTLPISTPPLLPHQQSQPVKKPQQQQFSSIVRKGRRSKHQNNNDSDDSSSDSDNERENDSKNNIKVNMKNAVNTTSKQSLLEVETERVMAAVVSSTIHTDKSTNSRSGGGVIDDSFFEINDDDDDDDDKDSEEVKDDNQASISNSTIISTGVNNHKGISDGEETNDQKLDIPQGHYSDTATNEKSISRTSSISSSSSTYIKPRRITKSSLHKQPVLTTITTTLIPTTLDNSNSAPHSTATLDSIIAATSKSKVIPITSSTTTSTTIKPDLSTAAKQALAAAMMYAQQQLDQSSSLTIAEEEEGEAVINDEENHQQSNGDDESDDEGEDSDSKEDCGRISNVVVAQVPTKTKVNSPPFETPSPSLSLPLANETNTHHSIKPNNTTHDNSSSSDHKKHHVEPAVFSTNHHSIRNNGQSMMSNDAVNNSSNSNCNNSTSSSSSSRVTTSSMKNHNMNDDDEDDVYSSAGLHSTKNNKDMIFNSNNLSSSSSTNKSVSSAPTSSAIPSSMKERNLHSNITTTAVPTGTKDSNHINRNDINRNDNDDDDNDSKDVAPIVKRSSGLKRVTKKKVSMSAAL